MTYLRRLTREEVMDRAPLAVDPQAEAVARGIVEDVSVRGAAAVIEYAERFRDLEPGADLIIAPAVLKKAFDDIELDTRALLQRTAARIEAFAVRQRESLSNLTMSIPGGRAGHSVAPVERAGCYAPAGRFPLPSSVLMTAVTARAAGVKEVWVASPRPCALTMAAAHVAGVDGFLAVGGAQAIAAFTYGAGAVPACDVIVGPGNKFVTAAKKVVSGQVAIDMLAGPSELTILADETADPEIVAADLLAQAEHDVDAIPILITVDNGLIDKVEAELERQLFNLSTAVTARRALENGFAVFVESLDAGVALCNRLAPEHLELIVKNASKVAPMCLHYGGLFIGGGTAEVFGDYGAGPNHTLPTGGTARYTGGLSVFNFLRIRTWIEIDDAEGALPLAEDAAQLASLEGLEGHARSAALRKKIE